MVDLTYGELYESATRFAGIYLGRGVKAGDTVFIILRHGPELFPAFLGAMLIGALPSFLPYLTPKQQADVYWTTHRTLFARVGARFLVTWSANLESMRSALPDFSLEVCLIDEMPETLNTLEVPASKFTGPAFMQHSSGTTGLKKGVVITHEALHAQVQAYSQAVKLKERDCIATWLPLYHDMGLIACFLMPAMTGVPVVAMDPFAWVVKPAVLLDAMEQYACTLAWLPNFAFHHLCATVPSGKAWNLALVRAIIDCSEPCRIETLELFAHRFGGMGLSADKLQTCYALAENVFAATQSSLGEPVTALAADRSALQELGRFQPASAGAVAVRLASCGYPLNGVQLKIRNTEGIDLAEDMIGEITLAGDSLFNGYHCNPEETAARLADGWYSTRDLGFLHGGALYVTGRVDDLLIVHGVNYYAHDIEHAVNRVQGVIPGRCVAIAEFRPDIGTSEVIVLAEHDASTDREELEVMRAIKRGILAETGLLVQQVGMVAAGWLIKTTSGKISRAENLARFRDQSNLRAKQT